MIETPSQPTPAMPVPFSTVAATMPAIAVPWPLGSFVADPPTNEAPATICYTLDGSAPTCDAATATCTGTAATYSAGSPLQIDAPTGGGSVRVRAIACKVGQTTSANISESSVGFRVAQPQATLPEPSEVAPGTQFTLSTATLDPIVKGAPK